MHGWMRIVDCNKPAVLQCRCTEYSCRSAEVSTEKAFRPKEERYLLVLYYTLYNLIT